MEFLGYLGFDWVLIDAEHDGIAPRDAYPLVMAADNTKMASVVRVPSCTTDAILPFAESGVSAVMSAHVRTAADGRLLVEALAYPPVGVRGAAAGRAANYGLTQTEPDYFADSGNHAVPIALLEDVSAYQDLDALLAIDGLDIFCLGTGDLAASMGRPGRSGDPEVQAMAAAASERILAAGKVVGTGTGSGPDAKMAAERGSRFIHVSNTGLLASAAREFLAAARGNEA